MQRLWRTVALLLCLVGALGSAGCNGKVDLKELAQSLRPSQPGNMPGAPPAAIPGPRPPTGPSEPPIVIPAEVPGTMQSPATAAPTGYPTATSAPPTIKIASFNIQVFGVSKLKKTPVMQVLAEVVRRFDVVAIQEVRATDDNVVPQFLALINANGARYNFVIGPRLGRTNSKEQYAVLFNTARIEVDRGSVYTVDDPQDLLHREPSAWPDIDLL